MSIVEKRFTSVEESQRWLNTLTLRKGEMLTVTVTGNNDSPASENHALDSGSRPIWEAFEDVLSEVPQQALDALPEDSAEHHDHYLYGMPKQG